MAMLNRCIATTVFTVPVTATGRRVSVWTCNQNGCLTLRNTRNHIFIMDFLFPPQVGKLIITVTNLV